MNDEQKSIWKFLNENAIGFANRKSSTKIREALDLDSGDPTNEHVRAQIRDMIFNHKCIIGSLMFKKGYWIINNEEELDMVIKQLNGRANGVLERAKALQENWNNRDE